MAYFDHLVFGLPWVSPYVMIGYAVSRYKMKFHEVYILWGFRNNTNALAVLEMWVLGVWLGAKIYDWVVASCKILL